MAIAVFDVDGTLVTGTGTERRFVRWLFAGGHLGARQLAAFIGFIAFRFPAYRADVFRKNKAYLSGLETAAVHELAGTFVAHEVLDALHQPAVERLRRHLADGDRVLLLSGTLLPIALALGRALGVDHVIATRCAVRDARYIAAPPEVHPYGESKRTLFEAERRRFATDVGPVYAYADSRHDAALLAAVDCPVCVRPDRRLRALAAARGWPVLGDAGATPGT